LLELLQVHAAFREEVLQEKFFDFLLAGELLRRDLGLLVGWDQERGGITRRFGRVQEELLAELLVLLQFSEDLLAIRHHRRVQACMTLGIEHGVARINPSAHWRRQRVREPAFSNRASNALVLDLLEQFEVLRKPNARVMVPHVAEVAAQHQRAVLWLPANAEEILVWAIPFLIRGQDCLLLRVASAVCVASPLAIDLCLLLSGALSSHDCWLTLLNFLILQLGWRFDRLGLAVGHRSSLQGHMFGMFLALRHELPLLKGCGLVAVHRLIWPDLQNGARLDLPDRREVLERLQKLDVLWVGALRYVGGVLDVLLELL